MQNFVLWRAIHIILALIAIFFILFGINLLYMAYQMEDPFYFIMTFFASNLIILIGGALLVTFIYKILRNVKKGKQ